MPKQDTKAAAVSNGPEVEKGESQLTPPAADAEKDPTAAEPSSDLKSEVTEDTPPADTPAADPSADLEAETTDLKDEPVDISKVKRVRVITKGPLGPKLIKPGEITSLPEYVALLKTEKGRKKVEAVQ